MYASAYFIHFFHLPPINIQNKEISHKVLHQLLVQAPWNTDACSASMKSSGIYEAAGLALWMRTGIWSLSKDRDVDPGDVSYAALSRFSDIYFSKAVTLKTHVTRDGKKLRARDRLVWPVPMVCTCENVSELEKKVFESNLNLVGCHFVLWSWYVALASALRNNVSWISFHTARIFLFLQLPLLSKLSLRPSHLETNNCHSGQGLACIALGGRPQCIDSDAILP